MTVDRRGLLVPGALALAGCTSAVQNEAGQSSADAGMTFARLDEMTLS